MNTDTTANDSADNALAPLGTPGALSTLTPEAGDANHAITSAKRRFNAYSVVMGVVVVVSAALVYGMRQYSISSGVNPTPPIKVEYPLDGKQTRNPEHDRILADLERSGQPVQIPVDAIQKNPFLLQLDKPTQANVVTDDPNAEARRRTELQMRLAEERRQKLEAELNGIEVHSVLEGRVPVARIGDKIVKVGDPVGQFLTVFSIDGRTVILADAEGKQYTKFVGADSTRSGPARNSGPSRPRR